MFNLYYPQSDGSLLLIGEFASQALALAQVASDNAVNYTIQQMDGSNVVMVMSC